MPKIIEHLRENLILEARRQIAEVGYRQLNIRSVAKNCGVGIGTIYNYFPSKDALVAAFMAEDWQICLSQIRRKAVDFDTALAAVYQELQGFSEKYQDLFQDASEKVPAPPREYHKLLRDQIGEILSPWCDDSFTAQFLAESLLTWTMAGIPLPTLQKILKKVL